MDKDKNKGLKIELSDYKNNSVITNRINELKMKLSIDITVKDKSIEYSNSSFRLNFSYIFVIWSNLISYGPFSNDRQIQWVFIDMKKTSE